MEMKIIDEQLKDKQQIVTYKYLIEKLDIHPNKAKQLLKDYVSKLTNDNNYSVTIVIGGTLEENDEFCIVLAHDDHVESMRRRFKQINFQHLYSIQPINRFDDINNALYLAENTLNNNGNLHSSIKKSISICKQSIQVAKEIDISVTKEIINNTNNTKLNKIEKKKTGLDIFNESRKANNTKSETKVLPKKKNGLDTLCESKTNNSKSEVTGVKVSPVKANSDFFSKFKPSSSSVNKADSKIEILEEKTIKKDDIKPVIEPPKKKVQDDLSNECETSKAKKKTNKKKENGKNNKSSQKIKRKRIQTFNSSDDEIDSEEEDKKRSDLVMDVEDEVDLVQPTPPRPTPREYRKKEKQTTTSTFIDEDGFVCTTKEVQMVEIESTEIVGDIENTVSKKLNIEPVAKKIKTNEVVQVDKKKNKNKQSKNMSSQGMKQSSLTNFFKTK